MQTSPAAMGDFAEDTYGELRTLAALLLSRESRWHILQPPSLVAEAYVRLAPCELRYQDRHHYVAVHVRAMKHALVDDARHRHAQRRGGDYQSQACRLDQCPASCPDTENTVAVKQALRRLRAIDPSLAAMVKLKFYAGLSHQEIARRLGKSLRSVDRDWRRASEWLRYQLATTGLRAGVAE